MLANYHSCIPVCMRYLSVIHHSQSFKLPRLFLNVGTQQTILYSLGRNFICSFIIFLGVYNGIVNNQNLPRFVRYNAMQAVLLDILLM